MTTPTEHRGWTPGPWRIEGRRGPGYIISAGTNEQADGPAAYVGVLDPVFYVAGEPSDLEANAHLIAASPVLVEALEKCVDDFFGPWGQAGRDRFCREYPGHYITVARAALRLARGEK